MESLQPLPEFKVKINKETRYCLLTRESCKAEHGQESGISFCCLMASGEPFKA